MQGVSGCRQHIARDYRRPERTGFWYLMPRLLPDGAAPPIVSHLILESRLENKVEKPRRSGAPLRNRTVDLLLTMHARFV
jgi:hypothetical protein